MPETNKAKGPYDTAIALAVVALFGIFGIQYLGYDSSDELHPLDDLPTEQAGFFDAEIDRPSRASALEARREREADLEDAYQRGVLDAEARYEQQLQRLRLQNQECNAMVEELVDRI